MSSADGSDDSRKPEPVRRVTESIEYLLFESLVHHLIEKGVLTKNDAMSVVQTVAEVKRGQLHEALDANPEIETALFTLKRIYSSFEASAERRSGEIHGENVRFLRPPLHDGHPQFPDGD